MFKKRVIKITSDINKLRDEIDAIDKKIIDLILNRMKIVHQVGLTKSKSNSRIYVPEREVAIYKKLSALSEISTNDIASFYTEIISFCRKLEGILDVAIKKDVYSLLAVKKLFGEHVNSIFIDNFCSLDTNKIKYILSSLNNETLDFIQKNNWFIINKVDINNDTLYLFSSFENTILNENDTAIIHSTKKVSEKSIQIDINIFITLLTYKEFLDSKDLTLLGVIPSI
ncbi:MAG: chorismate mutase [Cetobacterium sp.]